MGFGIIAIFLIIVGASAVGLGIFSENRNNQVDTMNSPEIDGMGGDTSAFFLQQLMQQQHIDQEMVRQMEQMNLQQMQEFALQNQLVDQLELERIMQETNPYLHPGQDIVVDEGYFGIDHGGLEHGMDEFGVDQNLNDGMEGYGMEFDDYGLDHDGNDFGMNDFDDHHFDNSMDNHMNDFNNHF